MIERLKNEEIIGYGCIVTTSIRQKNKEQTGDCRMQQLPQNIMPDAQSGIFCDVEIVRPIGEIVRPIGEIA